MKTTLHKKTTNQKKFNWLGVSNNYLKIFFFQNVKIYRFQGKILTINKVYILDDELANCDYEFFLGSKTK